MSAYVLNYMNRFVCLGGECPDICCREWPVHLSRHDLEILLASVQEDLAGRGDILQHITLDPMAEHRQFAGCIKWNKDNECPFLDAKRLCGLYKRLGGGAQPAVCALYPRSFVKWGERLELSGALSCPEVVRLILDLDDPLFWSFHSDLTHHPRLQPQNPCGGREQSPWCEESAKVRQVLCGFITNTNFPLASRLLSCALFAQQTMPDYVRVGSSPTAQSALQRAMALMGGEDLPAVLHQHWLSISLSLPMAHAVIDAIALHGKGGSGVNNPYFGKLIQDVMQGYGCTQASVIHETILLRQRGLHPSCDGWLNQAFDRFAHHYLLQEAILHYDDVPSYVRRLAVAVMVCRFLFFGLVGEECSSLEVAEQMVRVRQTVLTVFHRFSKSFSHYRMDLSELDALPKLLMFLRLW